jgi:hypothetical protein
MVMLRNWVTVTGVTVTVHLNIFAPLRETIGGTLRRKVRSLLRGPLKFRAFSCRRYN